MPNVVEAYKAFKDKGFGIVGVSLDENADKWNKEAITALNITWPQMSDLQGWNNAGAKLYGVNSIPATVLVDQEGTIVARNLRGDAIKSKLNELLNRIPAKIVHKVKYRCLERHRYFLYSSCHPSQ